MTMQIEVTMTLAELVDAQPGLAREFERVGLDYCCGGGRSFAAACAERGLDDAQLASELAAIAEVLPPAEWTTMDAGELVDHLEQTHHRFLWDEMPRITALVDKIVSVHGGRHPELDEIAACYGAVRADLEPHLLKEERILFPMVRELTASTELPSLIGGSLRGPISVMLAEHDTVGALLAEVRELTEDYTPPADGCATYVACFAALAEIEADTHLHIHKENNVLFPMVVHLEADREVS
jgi:regulator of cell morphogenesis and NO signaling